LDRAAEPVVEVKGLRFSYGDDRLVLDDIDLEARRGEIVTIMGPSGCGKTTLLCVLVGLELFDGGSVRVFG